MTGGLRRLVPGPVQELAFRARRGRQVAVLSARERRRWREILRTPTAAGGARVSYGYDRLPSQTDVAFGGMVKFQLLAETFPNAPRDFNLLYLGSSSLPPDARALAVLARRRGAKLVWNQNGVAYRGWFPHPERLNRPRARLLHRADHVFFQSAFCKLGADRFYGERAGPWEVLHNPVDTRRFTPAERRPPRPLTLLLGGNQYQRYRFEAALRALALTDEARLIVTGALSWSQDAGREALRLLGEIGVGDRVELVGPYTQAEAPELIRRADVLLHTKYNDPCPTIVLEAMACGLPVVYSASGGVPELVGDEAGVGIQAPLDWEHDHVPAPEELAGAVARVADGLDDYAAAARARSERFDVRQWVDRHRLVFERLLG